MRLFDKANQQRETSRLSVMTVWMDQMLKERLEVKDSKCLVGRLSRRVCTAQRGWDGGSGTEEGGRRILATVNCNLTLDYDNAIFCPRRLRLIRG